MIRLIVKSLLVLIGQVYEKMLVYGYVHEKLTREGNTERRMEGHVGNLCLGVGQYRLEKKC